MTRPGIRGGLWVGLAVVGLAAALVPISASAGVIVKKATVKEIADPTYLYEFELELVSGTLANGATFVLYDLFDPFPPIEGEVSTDHPATSPAGWNQGETLFGPPFPTPPGITDSTLLTNIYWLYNGPTIDAGAILTFTVTVIRDTYLLANPEIDWAVTPGSGGTAGTSTGVARTVLTNLASVPEPSSVVLLGIGGAGLGLAGLRRWSRRQAVAA